MRSILCPPFACCRGQRRVALLELPRVILVNFNVELMVNIYCFLHLTAGNRLVFFARNEAPQREGFGRFNSSEIGVGTDGTNRLNVLVLR